MNPEEYEKLARVEDSHWYFRALHGHVARCLRETLPRGREARILDAGCGTGGLARRIGGGGLGWSWELLDFAPEACAHARSRVPFSVTEGSVCALPFPDQSFDAVVSNDVLCQLPEEQQSVAAREFSRVLRPGGILIMNLPAGPGLFSYHDRCVGNLRRYQPDDLPPLLSPAGFRGVRSAYWNSFLLPFIWFRRRVCPPREARSDVSELSSPVNALFRAILCAETLWLEIGLRCRFGVSMLVSARKPLAEELERL